MALVVSHPENPTEFFVGACGQNSLQTGDYAWCVQAVGQTLADARRLYAARLNSPGKMKQIARLGLSFFAIIVLALYFFGDRFEVFAQPTAMSFEEFARAHAQATGENQPNNAASSPSESMDQIHQEYQSYLNDLPQRGAQGAIDGSRSATGEKNAGFKASWQRVYTALSVKTAAEPHGITKILAEMGVWVTFAALVLGIVAINLAIGRLERKARA